MRAIDPDTLCQLALAFHGLTIEPGRAERIAQELNSYLATLSRLKTQLSFDDAPADFVLTLMSYSDGQRSV